MDKALMLAEVGFQRGYLSLLVDDVAEEQMCAQPGGIVNHPAWQIGHLAGTFDSLTKLLGGASALDESWGKRFGQGSKPSADRAAYPSKAELLRVFDDRRKAMTQAFEQAGSDVLKRPTANER